MEELIFEVVKETGKVVATVAAAAIATLAVKYGVRVIVLKIEGIINIKRLRDEMRKEGIRKALLRAVNQNTNVVKLKDLCENKELVLNEGNGIDDEIREGDVIYA